jgi:hypothetical protein
METSLITVEAFKKRLVDLCLRSGLTDFPVKRRDQLVLLKSIAIGFDATQSYSETEINAGIKDWLARMSRFPGWDHLTLRRRLVDEGLLSRTQDGSCYRMDPIGPAGVVFDPAIDGLDVFGALEEGQGLIARKKAEYLRQSG